MTSFRISIIAVLFLGLKGKVNAQYDYAVTNDGDTLFGKIKTNLLGKSRIISDIGDVMINVGEISCYYLNKKEDTYYNKVIPETGKNTFVLQIEKGKLNIYSHIITYYYGNGKSGSVTQWYVEKDNEGLELLKSSSAFAEDKKSRKELLRSLLADNPVTSKMLEENDTFSFSRIQELIREYNK
jgi:hypothetical protein